MASLKETKIAKLELKTWLINVKDTLVKLISRFYIFLKNCGQQLRVSIGLKAKQNWPKQKEILIRFIRLGAIFIVFFSLARVVSFTLLRPTKTREITGIIFQFIAGLVFAGDQISPHVNDKSLQNWLSKYQGGKQWKLIILIATILMFFTISLDMNLVKSDISSVAVAPLALSAFMAAAFSVDVYLGSFKNLVEWSEKRGISTDRLKLRISNSTLINLFLWVISLATGVIGTYIVIAIQHTPFYILALAGSIDLTLLLVASAIFVMSSIYFLVWMPIRTLLWIRQSATRRNIFWVAVIVMWVWGSALLLTNAFKMS